MLLYGMDTRDYSLILGIVAITRHKGKGMAAVAIVISLLGFIIGTAITLMSVAQADNGMSMKEALNIIFISCLVLAVLEVVLLAIAKWNEKYGDKTLSGPYESTRDKYEE